MVAYAGIQTYAVNDGAGVKTFHLSICVQLIEETHAQCQIGVGKQLYCLGLGGSHIESIYVLLDGSLLQQAGKLMCSLLKARHFFVKSNDDS